MVRRVRRGWLIVIGVTTLNCPSAANGQIFARAPVGGPLPAEAPVEGNVACGLMSCPPNAVTFGVYHEHWRRWPEEPAAAFPADVLSPFPRPPREVPPVQPPDATHEESLAPPRRGIDGAAAPPAESASGPAAPPRPPVTSPPPPAVQPPTERDRPTPAPSEDRPSPLDQPAAPPSSGGFFPSLGDEDFGGLPDDLPDTDLEGSLPPADLDGTTPSQPPSVEPPQDDPDDIFNLDDFGQADPHRLHRYRLSSTRQLRRTDGDARAARVPPPRSSHSRPPVQLAGYRRSANRANPLRANVPPANDPALRSAIAYDHPPVEEPEWQAEPARFESVQSEPSPLTWSEPTGPARRTNPLR